MRVQCMWSKILDTNHQLPMGDFPWIMFWPTQIGPMLPHGDLLFKEHYKYNMGKLAPNLVQPVVSLHLLLHQFLLIPYFLMYYNGLCLLLLFHWG